MESRVHPGQHTIQAHGARDHSELRIHLLGSFSMSVDGREVPESAFARRKATGLIKLLALQHDHQLHRDQVVDSLWPKLGISSAGTQLYKAIHHVRQAMLTAEPSTPVDELLFLRAEVLGMSAPGGVATDVQEFEAAARAALATRDLDLIRGAIDLYHGDLLPSDLYEEWTTARREALRETLVDLLLGLGEGLLATGSLSEASDALRQAIAREPAREDAHRALMLAYARQGNRGRALRQFQICVDALQEELGVSVSSETQRLCQDIRDTGVQRLDRQSRPVMAELAIIPPIVGRTTEIRGIATCLDELAGGHGAVLGLRGGAGVGKTRLAQEILRFGWRRRWHVMTGAAHEQEGQIPYLPFIEALRQALTIDPTYAGLIPSELAQIMPELPPSATPAQLPDRLAAQHALFAGVLRFLMAKAGDAPIILVLDDLHAMDDGSLKLFHYLARSTEKLPLLLVGCWRDDDPEEVPALSGIVESLSRLGLLHIMDLSPLAEPDHRSLIEQTLGRGRVDPMLAGQLYASSEGNPLFAREIATRLVADGAIVESHGIWRLTAELVGTEQAVVPAIPRSLRALALRRIETLSPAATRLIQGASVIGRDVPLPFLNRLLERYGVQESTLLDVLDEALAAGLLVESGLGVRFPHALLRAAVYDEMTVARRTALHATAAATIETMYAGEPESTPVETIAYQYRHAGNVPKAVQYLILAGDRAEAVYDHEGALQRFAEALELLNGQPGALLDDLTVTLHERIGDVQRATGNVQQGLKSYLAALNSPGEDKRDISRDRRHALHHKITLGAILVADMPAATEHLEHTRALVGNEPVARARHLILESLYFWHCLDFEAAIDRATQALELAEKVGAVIEASQACEMLAIAYMPLGNWKESLRYEMRRQIPDWSPEIVVAIDAHLCLYQYKLHNEESLDEIRTFIQAVAEQATTVGNLRCLAVCYFMLGYLAMLQGKPEVAADSVTRAIDLHERIGSPAGVAYAIAQQAGLLTAAGAYESVPGLVQTGMEFAQRASIRDHCLTQLHTVNVRNLIEAGDLPGARTLVDVALAHNTSCAPCAVCQVDLYASLAAYHVATGTPAAALEYVEQGLQLADHARNGPGRGRLLRLRGQAHAVRGEREDAERCFSEAARIFRQTGDRYDLARAIHAHAALDAHAEDSPLRAEADQILSRYHTSSVAAALPS